MAAQPLSGLTASASPPAGAALLLRLADNSFGAAQPYALAAVAMSGSYADLTDKPPALPTTAATAPLTDATVFYTAAGTYTWATLKVAFATFLVSLPTALPSTSGQLWNNGGALAIS